LEHLRLILDTAAADESIIATAYQGTVGVPAYFPALYLDDLAKLRGDSGAKSLIKKKMDQLIKIPYHDASIDIDTEKDWLEFLQERQGR